MRVVPQQSWTGHGTANVCLLVQLLKLACGHLIPTPFYLITDADTFYLNPFSAGATSTALSHNLRSSCVPCVKVLRIAPDRVCQSTQGKSLHCMH